MSDPDRDRDATIPSLSEALPREMARVRRLRHKDAGARLALKHAEQAIIKGDVCRMVAALNSLKAHK